MYYFNFLASLTLEHCMGGCISNKVVFVHVQNKPVELNIANTGELVKIHLIAAAVHQQQGGS